MAFSAPDNYEQLFRETEIRVLKLIDLKYIDNIDKGSFKEWMKNFLTPEEKYFATLLIYKLIYRSEKAILSMFNNLFELEIPQLLENLNLYEIDSIKEWKEILKNPTSIKELPFRISTITNVDDNIGKSGEDLNRLLKEKQIIFKSINVNLSSKNEIPKKVEFIILIDDIAGTGKQFEKFYNKFKKGKLKLFKKIIYMPLAAHHESISFIENLDDRIIVKPLEVLNGDKIFISNKKELIDGINTLEDLEIFYKELLQKRNIGLKTEKHSLNILYVFKISSPNTNLPLIYHEDKNWNKLFIRF